MSEQSAKPPKFFLLKAMIFPVLVVPVVVVTLLVIRGNEAEQLYYQALDLAAAGKFEAAAEKFKRSGDLGHADSSYNLALLYSSGALDAPDSAQQVEKNLRQAALNGSIEAEYELGKIAEYSAQPDLDRAAMHYRKAALGGHADALTAMGRLHENGWGVNQSLTLAGEFYRKGAQRGGAENNAELGFFLLSGAEGQSGIDQAEAYLQIAARGKHPKALTALGYIYEKKQKITTAVDYYRQAAELNDPEGMVNYGDHLLKSNRIQDALDLFTRAAEEQNFAPALHRLGMYYYSLPQPDYSRAKRYFERAAAQNNAASWFNLGVMAEHGLGADKDPARASECYYRAQQLGFQADPDSMRQPK